MVTEVNPPYKNEVVILKTIFLIRHSLKEKKYYSDIEIVDKQKFDEQKKLSEEGKELAKKLSQLDVLKNVKEVWASNYERAIETAKYIADGKNINITNSFDERHYGNFDEDIDKEEFWINQFKDENLKNEHGESQKDVRKRFDDKINHILENSSNDEIAIVSHNAAILFYLLKYCNLISAEVSKRITIGYKDKILIKGGIMKSPSIMKLNFDNNELVDIEYIEV